MESEDAIDAGSQARAVRVETLRASLTTQVDVETLLAEAGAIRAAALRDADAILAEAQRVADDLASDARRDAERLAASARTEGDDVVGRARADAAAIRSRAEADVEDYRRRVRQELTEQVAREVAERARVDLVAVRDRSEAMIGDLAASVRILGVALGTAQTNVGEMLTALDELRVYAVEGIGAPGPTSDGVATSDDDLDDAPPVTAMDAYLRLAHVDFGDPPLPAVDDSEVGARYVRDAKRSRGVAVNQDVDQVDDEDDGDEGEHETDGGDERDESPADDAGRPGADRPLGWLFRSAP